MKKILAVLVNFGDDQLHYLEKVVKNLKFFKKYNTRPHLQFTSNELKEANSKVFNDLKNYSKEYGYKL